MRCESANIGNTDTTEILMLCNEPTACRQQSLHTGFEQQSSLLREPSTSAAMAASAMSSASAERASSMAQVAANVGCRHSPSASRVNKTMRNTKRVGVRRDMGRTLTACCGVTQSRCSMRHTMRFIERARLGRHCSHANCFPFVKTPNSNLNNSERNATSRGVSTCHIHLSWHRMTTPALRDFPQRYGVEK